jgi:dTDP-4-dehydrorhamnose 3,5-epimerase-like enzyme
MKVVTTAIQDLLIIVPTVYKDNRGYFYEAYNQEVFAKMTLPVRSRQPILFKARCYQRITFAA